MFDVLFSHKFDGLILRFFFFWIWLHYIWTRYIINSLSFKHCSINSIIINIKSTMQTTVEYFLCFSLFSNWCRMTLCVQKLFYHVPCNNEYIKNVPFWYFIVRLETQRNWLEFTLDFVARVSDFKRSYHHRNHFHGMNFLLESHQKSIPT